MHAKNIKKGLGPTGRSSVAKLEGRRQFDQSVWQAANQFG
jgi:hypothetical protein